MTLYGWYTGDPPTRARREQGCPATGWVHEGHPPWRVITSADPATLKAVLPELGKYITIHRGPEARVDLVDWWPAPLPVLEEKTTERGGTT